MLTKKVKNFLFNEPSSSSARSLLLFLVRIIFGFMFLSHGIAKWTTFKDMTQAFPDPLNIGETMSFWLVLFAEVVCTFGFMLGALFRLCLIPMIFTMLVAFFVIHSNDPFATKELSLMYLTIFLLMFISGPGRYSADAILKEFFR